jgi:acetyl esterase/lipase
MSQEHSIRPPFHYSLARTAKKMSVDIPPDGYDAEEIRIRRERWFDNHESIDSLVSKAGLEKLDIIGPDSPVRGEPIELTLIRPADAHGEMLPCVYSIHGGGLVRGNGLDGAVELVEWASQLRVAVVAVEYGLAPDLRNAEPAEECFAALKWFEEIASTVKVDPTRLILQGVSAGGGIAASVALMARDRGAPSLVGVMLNSPMLDDRNETISARQFSCTPGWNREVNLWGWGALLGTSVGSSGVAAYASASRAKDLSGLPNTFIDVGSAEVFRDEAVDFAGRIWAAGGRAELHVWEGGFHGFERIAPEAQLSRSADAVSRDWLMRTIDEVGSGK